MFSPELLEGSAGRLADFLDVQHVEKGGLAAVMALAASADITHEHTSAIHRGLRGRMTVAEEILVFTGVILAAQAQLEAETEGSAVG